MTIQFLSIYSSSYLLLNRGSIKLIDHHSLTKIINDISNFKLPYVLRFRHQMYQNMTLVAVLTILLVSYSSYAVVNGTAAPEKRFRSIGALRIGDENAVGCTATLIAPDWIVTADHCIHATAGSEEEGGEPLSADQYEFRLGSDFKHPFLKTKLKRWVNGPTIDKETVDIAFGELENPIDLKRYDLQVVRIGSQKWTAADFKIIYLHVGYGTREAFGSHNSPLADKRQSAQFKATSKEGNALLKLFSSSQKLEDFLRRFAPQSLEAQEIEAIIAGAKIPHSAIHAWDDRGRTDISNIKQPEAGWQDTCFGDSGGPLLRDVDGHLEIVGVVSQGMDRICSPLGTRFTTFGYEVRILMGQLGL